MRQATNVDDTRLVLGGILARGQCLLLLLGQLGDLADILTSLEIRSLVGLASLLRIRVKTRGQSLELSIDLAIVLRRVILEGNDRLLRRLDNGLLGLFLGLCDLDLLGDLLLLLDGGGGLGCDLGFDIGLDLSFGLLLRLGRGLDGLLLLGGDRRTLLSG